MNLTEYRAKIELYRRELTYLETIRVSCGTCNHNASGFCAKFQAAPPDDFRKSGCEEWEYDGIPF